jgi:hypothetical protein
MESGLSSLNPWDVYERTSSKEKLNQGDLIRFDGGDSGVTWGVVVTADCDLENRKHSRLVTLVPLLSVQQIIVKCLAFDFVEYKIETMAQKCRVSFGIDAQPTDPAFQSSMKATLMEEKVVNDKDRLLAKLVCGEDVEVSVVTFKEVVEHAGLSWSACVKRFESQIASRGDMLVLQEPPFDNNGEFIAWLRGIWQEQVANIAVAMSQSSGRRGVRVAQLKSPYRYRLTQMLGQVFSDIGLPDRQKTAIDPSIGSR